jgi:hypothetical protein
LRGLVSGKSLYQTGGFVKEVRISDWPAEFRIGGIRGKARRVGASGFRGSRFFMPPVVSLKIFSGLEIQTGENQGLRKAARCEAQS